MEFLGVNAFLFLLFSLCLHYVATSKVLLISAPIHSHCNKFGAIGESLTTRGHSVTAYIPQHWDSTRCLSGRGVDILQYKVDRQQFEAMQQDGGMPRKITFQAVFEKLTTVSRNLCSCILEDNESLKLLEKLKFDIAVVDTFPGSRCYLLIPYRLKIPFVSLMAMHSWFDTGKPFMPNVEPFLMFAYPPDMSFRQRLVNAIATFSHPFIMPWSLYGEAEKKFAPELSFWEYNSLIRNAELFLQDDDVIISGALPRMPNTVYTGGFTSRDPEPLPGDLEEFYSSATHGVIVVSFGTVIQYAPPRIHESFMEVFTNLSQKIHWKSDSEINHPNIKVSKWIPQNDVLGHRNTRLFIFHGGRNSFFESVYHGVPAICIPFVGDQPSNADNLQRRQIGVKLEPDSVTTPLLTSTIQRLLSESSFRQNVELFSAIYKDIHRERAGDISARAIEHVMKHGADHLRPQTLSLSLAAFVMVDVWLFLAVLASVVILVFCLCCNRVVRLFKNNKYKKD